MPSCPHLHREVQGSNGGGHLESIYQQDFWT